MNQNIFTNPENQKTLEKIQKHIQKTPEKNLKNFRKILLASIFSAWITSWIGIYLIEKNNFHNEKITKTQENTNMQVEKILESPESCKHFSENSEKNSKNCNSKESENVYLEMRHLWTPLPIPTPF